MSRAVEKIALILLLRSHKHKIACQVTILLHLLVVTTTVRLHGDNDETCCGYTLIRNDPLWDGQQCPGEETPCCSHIGMPWFNKALTETTTEDIELRLCGDQSATAEATPLEVIELFVR